VTDELDGYIESRGGEDGGKCLTAGDGRWQERQQLLTVEGLGTMMGWRIYRIGFEHSNG